jgi:hypothetical protein
MAALVAAAAAYGTFLLFTALVLGWEGAGPGPSGRAPPRHPSEGS